MLVIVLNYQINGDGGGDDGGDGDEDNGDNIVDGSSLRGVRSLSAVVGSDLTSNHKSSTTIDIIGDSSDIGDIDFI